MNLQIVDCGGIVTIQDLGRTGYQHLGVPVAGPMDWFALRAANALVDNPPGYAALEIGQGGLELQTEEDCLVAVTGWGYALLVEECARQVWKSLWTAHVLRPGDTLRLLPRTWSGWCYLAISGGLDVPLVLGSRSTFLRGFGTQSENSALKSVIRTQPVAIQDPISNFQYPKSALPFTERCIQPGDVLPVGQCNSITSVQPEVDPAEDPYPPMIEAVWEGVRNRSLRHPPALPRGHNLPLADQPAYSTQPRLGVILGPHRAAFSQAGVNALLNNVYTVTGQSDRMGYRLRGSTIAHARKGADAADILSEGLPLGAVQVPGDGQPIVALADRQTTGGYTCIATVCLADLPLLAQCPRGSGRVHFYEISIEAAQAKYRAMLNLLEQIYAN